LLLTTLILPSALSAAFVLVTVSLKQLVKYKKGAKYNGYD